MADWTTISALATAGGTLVLATATFASVRSANKAARTAERALEAGLRPLLMPGRVQDPVMKIMWGDQHWAHVGEGRANVEFVDGIVYLALPLRNVGAGIAVLHGWNPVQDWPPTDVARAMANASLWSHAEPEDFRRLSIDLYVAPGDIGYFLSAVREADDPAHRGLVEAIMGGQSFGIDLLYGDHEGGQRTISRFAAIPRADGEWMASSSRHWNIDRADPR